MSTKTISITEEAYERLYNKKKDRESFSDVIKRLTCKKSLLGFAGIFSKKEAREIEENIKKSRLASVKRIKQTGV